MSLLVAPSPAREAQEARARRGAPTAPPTGPHTKPTGAPPLRVVAPAPWSPPRAPFVLLVLSLLVGGLITLLVLNTTLAQGAFTLHDLEQRGAALADEEQALQQRVAVMESPDRLAEAARALGMVPSVNPVFLRLSDGAVLGVPEPAKAPPPPPAPTPVPTPAPAAAKPAAAVAAKPAAPAGAKPAAPAAARHAKPAAPTPPGQ